MGKFWGYPGLHP